MKRCLALLFTLLLSACSTAPLVPTGAVFDDGLFAAPAQPVDRSQVFALSEAMKRYLEVDLATEIRNKGERAALAEALSRRERLHLEYDSATTRTASQAFDARAGNCLSLVIMTSALARHLGMPVQYHSVFVDETWGRAGNLLVSSGHVNVTLNNRLGMGKNLRFDAVEAVTIDFDPPLPGQRQHSRVITESTVTAMFMNNRSAESLAAGQVDDAYWWSRAAIEAEPSFLPAYNTLAVVYLRRGALTQAERVLTQLLGLEPANAAALSNLVTVYVAQGRPADAQSTRERLASIEPAPPFHYFHRGLEALKKRDYAQAKSLFQKEVSRSAYYHEFHFGLAMALLGLGEYDEARRQLALAKASSTRASDRELYAGKLERMKELHLQ